MEDNKQIEHFFVNEDVQIQIDHLNGNWYDEYGKLLIEDMEDYLQDNGFIEDNIGEWRDTKDDKVYLLFDEDIQQLKRVGFCRMYLIG